MENLKFKDWMLMIFGGLALFLCIKGVFQKEVEKDIPFEEVYIDFSTDQIIKTSDGWISFGIDTLFSDNPPDFIPDTMDLIFYWSAEQFKNNANSTK